MKSALIIGGSKNVAYDVDVAFDIFEPDMIIGINDAGAVWDGEIDHWVTLHPQHWPEWLRQRSLPHKFQRWSPESELIRYKYEDCFEPELNLLPDYDPSGLSGLYAVKVALFCGATHIVLAGVPMDKSGHFTGDKRKHWISLYRRKAWEEHFPELKPHVRSLSGWTEGRFGRPTPDWLKLEVGLGKAVEAEMTCR